jgi:integrase
LNVSLRRKLGQDAKLIADQIGHTDSSFTQRLYTHIFEDDREGAAVSLADAFGTKGQAN